MRAYLLVGSDASEGEYKHIQLSDKPEAAKKSQQIV